MHAKGGFTLIKAYISLVSNLKSVESLLAMILWKQVSSKMLNEKTSM